MRTSWRHLLHFANLTRMQSIENATSVIDGFAKLPIVSTVVQAHNEKRLHSAQQNCFGLGFICYLRQAAIMLVKLFLIVKALEIHVNFALNYIVVYIISSSSSCRGFPYLTATIMMRSMTYRPLIVTAPPIIIDMKL